MVLGKTTKLGIGAVLLGIGMYLGSVWVKKRISNLIQAEIVHFNRTKPYTLTFDHLQLSLWNSSAEFQNLSLHPDSIFNGAPLPPNFDRPHIVVQNMQMEGLELPAILLHKRLVIANIALNGISVRYQKNPGGNGVSTAGSKKEAANTILLNELKEIRLGHFSVHDFAFTLTETNQDTLASYTLNKFDVDGIQLLKKPRVPRLFSINTDNLNFRLSNQRLGLAQKEYDLQLGSVQFNAQKGVLQMSDVSYAPTYSKEELGSKFTYNQVITESWIPHLFAYGLQAEKLFFNQGIILDSILMEHPKFVLYKDMGKPWDKNKRPSMPSELMREVGNRFYFKKLVATKAELDYTEKTEQGKLLKVPMKNVELTIQRTEQNKRDDQLDMAMECVVFKDLSLKLDLSFPNFMSSDDFYFTGSTGSTTFQSFNPVLLPTSGIRFEKGNLQGMSFEGRANATKSSGKLIMRYSDLHAVVLKKDESEKNKMASFLANRTIRTSNPSKNGRTMVGEINFERVEYKGFGNFLFKSVESGIINSVYPFGKRRKKK